MTRPVSRLVVPSAAFDGVVPVAVARVGSALRSRAVVRCVCGDVVSHRACYGTQALWGTLCFTPGTHVVALVARRATRHLACAALLVVNMQHGRRPRVSGFTAGATIVAAGATLAAAQTVVCVCGVRRHTELSSTSTPASAGITCARRATGLRRRCALRGTSWLARTAGVCDPPTLQ